MVVTDLDETLLRGDKTVSEYTKDVLARCRASGIKTVIATGRGHPVDVAPVWLFDGIVANNGASIFDGKTEIRHCVPYSEARPVLLACHARGLQVSLLCGGVRYTNFDCSKLQGWERVPFTRVDFASCMLDTEKICIVNVTHEVAAFIRDHLARDLYLQVARDGLGMIMHRRATKSAGVAELAARWNISREGVVAFGDDANDTDLLAWAGTGIAVDNALEEVKAAADLVCGGCDEDGVAKWLEQNAGFGLCGNVDNVPR